MAAKISESGFIGKDGKMRLPMERINQHINHYKGARVIVTVEVLESESTAAQQSYYYRYIVPTIREAFKNLGNLFTDEGVDSFLVATYRGDKANEKGEEARFARQLSRGQMSDFIGWLKMYAAENLEVFIDDAI